MLGNTQTSGSTGATTPGPQNTSETGDSSTNPPQYQDVFTLGDFPPLNINAPQTVPNTTNWENHLDGRTFAHVVEQGAALNPQLAGAPGIGDSEFSSTL